MCYSLVLLPLLVFLGVISSLAWLSLAETPRINGLRLQNTSLIRPIPSCPHCSLHDQHVVTKPVMISIWKYKGNASNHISYLLSRSQIDTYCHENLFGAEEKTIVRSFSKPWKGTDDLSTKDNEVIKNLRAGTFEENLPWWNCGYWSNNLAENTIYHAKQLAVQYSPATGEIIYPSNPVHTFKSGVFLLESGELLIFRDPNAKFSKCEISLYKSGYGSLFITSSTVHQIIANQFKEAFYFNELAEFSCKDQLYYQTLGGYILSYKFVQSDDTPPPSPPPSSTVPSLSSTLSSTTPKTTTTTTPGRPGAGEDLFSRIRRQASQDNSIISNKSETDNFEDGSLMDKKTDEKKNHVVPHLSEQDSVILVGHNSQEGHVIFDCITEAALQMSEGKLPLRPISPTDTCDTLKINNRKSHSDSKHKREAYQTLHELSDPIYNYQHSLNRAELQWGLFHLANLTSDNLIQLAKDLCESKMLIYNQIVESMDESLPRIMELDTFYPDLEIGNISLSHNQLIITLYESVEVALANPLICCEYYCKLTDGNWIKSHTGRIKSEITSCLWKPKSFVVKDIKSKNWVDILSNQVINPLFTLSRLEQPSPTEYSFNMSEMHDISDYLNPSETIHAEFNQTHSKQIVTNHSQSIFTTFWSNVGHFFKSLFSSLIGDLVILLIGILLVIGLLNSILNIRIKRKRKGLEMIPMIDK